MLHMDTLIILFYLAAHSLQASLFELRPDKSFARQTQKFCLRDLRRQKHQSLRDAINAYA
jgi:hypothetical protein